MNSLFKEASVATPDTGSWNMTNMNEMFKFSGATYIDFSSWDFSSVTNYETLLQRMDRTATAVNITFKVTGFTYSSSAQASAINNLVLDGWLFSGDIAGSLVFIY